MRANHALPIILRFAPAAKPAGSGDLEIVRMTTLDHAIEFCHSPARALQSNAPHEFHHSTSVGDATPAVPACALARRRRARSHVDRRRRAHMAIYHSPFGASRS